MSFLGLHKMNKKYQDMNSDEKLVYSVEKFQELINLVRDEEQVKKTKVVLNITLAGIDAVLYRLVTEMTSIPESVVLDEIIKTGLSEYVNKRYEELGAQLKDAPALKLLLKNKK